MNHKSSGVQLKLWWRTVTHGRGSEGETGEWSGLPVLFTLPRNMVYPALLPLMRTPPLPVVDWTDAPADLNGLVRFAERRNLVCCACVVTFQTRSTNDIKTQRAQKQQNKAEVKCSLSMLWRHVVGAELWLHSFLTLALDRGEWLTWRLG
jgi:hypothetical protein